MNGRTAKQLRKVTEKVLPEHKKKAYKVGKNMYNKASPTEKKEFRKELKKVSNAK